MQVAHVICVSPLAGKYFNWKSQSNDMGNLYSTGVNLRDICIPRNISIVKSNLIMAMCQGRFYPCVIIRNAETINDGYTVYFFHNSEETEIPSTNVIGNLKALLNCEISFVDESGLTCTGTVRATDSDNVHTQPMNFFVSMDNTCKWVSLPYIYLTMEQAQVLI